MRALARGRVHPGWCPICEKATLFAETGPWLRDQYLCRRCGSIPRWRAVAAMLQAEFPEWRRLAIFECAPGGAASTKLRTECPGYVASHFSADMPSGSMVNGLRNENLERLSLEDESIDIVVTQDVLEHVLRPEAAVREIARVLRPGGAHLFTVPLHSGRSTVVRAEPDGEDGIRLLAEPRYHGDPVDPNGSLVVREWGDDLVDFVEVQSGLPTEVHTMKGRWRGLDGEFLQVFISRKR